MDIPIGKKIVFDVVEATEDSGCKMCDFEGSYLCDKYECTSENRKDGKSVVFQLVEGSI